MKAKWFLYDEDMGESDIEMTFTHEQRHVPFSWVRVCQKCGDAWSKIEVQHPDTVYMTQPRLCPKCGPGVMGCYDDDLYEMPTEVAMREIMQMKKCKNYEVHLVTGGS